MIRESGSRGTTVRNFDSAVEQLLSTGSTSLPLDPFRSGYPKNFEGIFEDLSSHQLPTMIVAPNDEREEKELVNTALLCADRFVLLSKSPTEVAQWDGDGQYCYYTDGAEDFRRMVSAHRDLIERKLMIVLPRLKRHESEHSPYETEDASSRSAAVDVALFNATFVNDLLEPKSPKRMRASRTFIPIPLLSHVISNSSNDPKDIILGAREENRESATSYMKAVKKLMKASVENLTKGSVQDLLDEVYEEATGLQEQHLQIAKKYRLKSIEVIATCTVAFLCVISAPLPKELLLLLSTGSLGSRVYNYFTEKHLDLERLRSSPYYVPWRIGSRLGTV